MQLGAADDQSLFDAWRRGDPRAGDELVARHGEAVRKFVSRRVGSGADDALQEVWTALTRCLDRFQQRCTFRTYLFSIARNQIQEELRRRRRDARHDAYDDEADADLAPGADSVMEDSEEARRLAHALAALPVELQRLVALYYFERKTAREIGEMFGIPENTARSRLRRAKALLREALDGHDWDLCDDVSDDRSRD
jgi:RNA polymerase sigma factor (sigma-70 family)